MVFGFGSKYSTCHFKQKRETADGSAHLSEFIIAEVENEMLMHPLGDLYSTIRRSVSYIFLLSSK